MAVGNTQTVVTTSANPNGLQIQEALSLAACLGCSYESRDEKPLEWFFASFPDYWIVIVERDQWVAKQPKAEFFFHPAMSVLRIKGIIKGKKDLMAEAMDLRRNDSVLDCTLGIGADAIVASFIVGSQGKVVGIESNPVIAAMLRNGLARDYPRVPPEVLSAMNRIQVIAGDHGGVLQNMPANSYDVLYFDPMFQKTNPASSGISALKPLADMRHLTLNSVQEAVRVARRRVVIKQNRGFKEWNLLGIQNIIGGKYSSVEYGILETGE